jgi:TIR domain
VSGVFVSHSSQDKQFVAKLAVDLIGRGIPVWLDTWEMEIGDKLNDRIFEGIDDSTVLIIALSPASIQSQWVGKELKAALTKEAKLGRKVLMPIKIAPCTTPRPIADRVYADFSQNYLRGLESLEKAIRRLVGDLPAIPFEKKMMALSFTRGLFLDGVGLQNQYARLAPDMKRGDRMVPAQIIIAPDQKLDQMRNTLLNAIDIYGQQENYDPEFERKLRASYDTLEKSETALVAGIADIANGVISHQALFGESCRWYARIIRNEILCQLENAWSFAHRDEKPPLGTGVVQGGLSSRESAATFFGVDRVQAAWIFRTVDSSGPRNVWIDGRFSAILDVSPGNMVTLSGLGSTDLIDKYLIPQIIANARLYAPSSESWDWDNLLSWYIVAA